MPVAIWEDGAFAEFARNYEVTPAELAVFGQHLYGARWQSAMAQGLGVSVRAVQYWAAGRHRVSPDRAAAIVALARRRYTQRLSHDRNAYLHLAEALATPALKAALLVA